MALYDKKHLYPKQISDLLLHPFVRKSCLYSLRHRSQFPFKNGQNAFFNTFLIPSFPGRTQHNVRQTTTKFLRALTLSSIMNCPSLWKLELQSITLQSMWPNVQHVYIMYLQLSHWWCVSHTTLKCRYFIVFSRFLAF